MVVHDPDRRLMTAADFVRPGAVVADIGTDHAYLPVFLVRTGRAVRAVASDINRGPLERAIKNISAAGLDDRIDTLLTDGLDGIDRYGVTDIIICGMGGELIARIIDGASFTRNPALRLILQPMTKAAELRAFLCSSGFTVKDEALSEDRKIYQTLLCEYTGSAESYTGAELLLGKRNIERGGELFLRFARYVLGVLEARRSGRASSGIVCEAEQAAIDEIKSIIEKNGFESFN